MKPQEAINAMRTPDEIERDIIKAHREISENPCEENYEALDRFVKELNE